MMTARTCLPTHHRPMRLPSWLLPALLVLFPVLALAGEGDFLKLEELRPGMRGRVLSVFYGTEPESFAVELKGIVDGPVAGDKYLLLRLMDDRLRIGSGFSGSPVYFDGKLAGAVSQMEQNLTSQMVMAVPIARMLEEASRFSADGAWSPPAIAPPAPGSMISLPMVRGDFWMGTSGTVTRVDQGVILAFGHENLFSGDTVMLPIHRATVHGVISRSDLSHKEVSSLEEIGAVAWDGKSAIVGRLGVKAAMAPLLVEFRGGGGRSRRYRLEMVDHARLAPSLVARVVRTVVGDQVPNRPAGVDLDLTLTLGVKGLETPVVVNQRFSAEALKGEASPVQTLLSALLFPLAGPRAITFCSVALADLPEAKTGQIATAAFVRTRGTAGETVPLKVRLSGPYGEPKVVSVPVTIPAGYDRPQFTVSVQGGRSVRPSEQTPVSLLEISRWLAGLARSDELVVLSPGTVNDSTYPEARLGRTVARTPWNVEGSAEATITVIDSQ